MRTASSYVMPQRLRAALTSACICAFVGGAAAAAPPTLGQIQEGVARQEDLFFGATSLLLRYERTGSHDPIKTVASGGYLPAEWTFAYRGDKWLLQRRFTKPHGKGTPEDPLIPKDPRLDIINNDVLFEWDGEGREAIVDVFDSGRNIFGGLFYTRHLSFDAGRHIIAAAGVTDRIDELRKMNGDELDHPFLPDFMRANADHYKVAATPERVEGLTCWLVEWPSMDKLWVDIDHGYAIVRRVYCWGPGEPARFEYLNGDYREVTPGLWLPFRQTELRYASIIAEKKELWGKVACRSEFRVKEIAVNTLTDSFFDIKLPRGTQVADFVRDFRYTTSKEDISPFSEAIADGKDLLDSGADHSLSRLLLLLNIAVVAALMAFAVVRAFRRRASQL